MRSILVLVALVAAAPSCGADRPAAASGPHRPVEPAPKAAGPPAAFVEFGTAGRWLAQGSYCWVEGANGTGCADMVPPSMRDDIPVIKVPVGALGCIHLAFAPTKVELSIGGKLVPARVGRTIAFRVPRAGVLELFLNVSGGDASYLARVKTAAAVRPAPAGPLASSCGRKKRRRSPRAAAVARPCGLLPNFCPTHAI